MNVPTTVPGGGIPGGGSPGGGIPGGGAENPPGGGTEKSIPPGGGGPPWGGAPIPVFSITLLEYVRFSCVITLMAEGSEKLHL